MSRISAVLIVSLIAAILSPLTVATPITPSVTSFVMRDDAPTATAPAASADFTRASTDWLS